MWYLCRRAMPTTMDLGCHRHTCSCAISSCICVRCFPFFPILICETSKAKRNSELLLSHLRPANGNVVRQFGWKFSRDKCCAIIFSLLLRQLKSRTIDIVSELASISCAKYTRTRTGCILVSVHWLIVRCAQPENTTTQFEWNGFFPVRCAPLWWTGRFRCSIAMGMPFSLYFLMDETSKLICLLNINETYCLRLSTAV